MVEPNPMPSWTILLADPDPLQRQLVDMLLAQEQYHVVPAGNGRDTLEYLKEHTPNLAILALELPDVGGDVVCRKLKAVRRLSRVPVVLTTLPPGKGGASSDLRQLARAVGADLLLQKPLGDKGLRDKVNQLLRRWQSDAPDAPAPAATNNTVILEEALQELGHEQDESALDAITEGLYRENEELRAEVASLKRRLARLESGLSVRREGVDPPATFIPGSAPAAPAPAAPPAAPRTDAPPRPADGDADGTEGAEGADDAPAPGRTEPSGPGEAAMPDALPPDALPPDATREQLQNRVTDLERRNRALISALQDAEAKAADGPARGLFGRRRR